ncbi:hypothetical protein NBZ79_12065 [Sneathiella marina]|uniref:Lipoprotein n=1 Tax=Sneathiella marina TaxID=2950108 RepID=A0ABY4VZ50_9PROT|nr:hypothetical protein [Sneathiella marina]USG59911.1 hypothetical protein NBZ79_12065 [Sneathiella marina]
MKKLMILPLLLAVAACTTPRDDRTYSCEQLSAEYAENTKSAIGKFGQGKAMFGEGNGLLDMNVGVKARADRKGCDTKLWPAQPDSMF